MSTELTLSGEIKGPLSTKEDRTIAVPTATQEPSIAQMLQSALATGVDPAKLDKMLDVFERMEAKRAEREFNAAFAKLQSELPEIVAV